MPSTLHQGLAWAFADEPELAFELMREVFAIDLPPMHGIRDRRCELDQFVPCFGDTHELRPDLAFSGEFVKPRRGMRGAAVVVEIQRKRAAGKRWRIWVYRSLMAERLELPTAVMLVAIDEPVSRWARRLHTLELRRVDAPHSCECERLLVLDRQNMPRITDIAEARRKPGKMLLSALLHAAKEDMELLELAMKVALEQKDDRRWRYASCLLAATPEHRRAELKEKLTMEERYELTKLERNSIAYHDGLRDGQRKGKREGKREGKRAGIREGIRAGKREGMAELVLTILELRQIELDDAGVDRIRSCTNLTQLQRWARRAKRVGTAQELFAA